MPYPGTKKYPPSQGPGVFGAFFPFPGTIGVAGVSGGGRGRLCGMYSPLRGHPSHPRRSVAERDYKHQTPAGYFQEIPGPRDLNVRFPASIPLHGDRVPGDDGAPTPWLASLTVNNCGEYQWFCVHAHCTVTHPQCCRLYQNVHFHFVMSYIGHSFQAVAGLQCQNYHENPTT